MVIPLRIFPTTSFENILSMTASFISILVGCEIVGNTLMQNIMLLNSSACVCP